MVGHKIYPHYIGQISKIKISNLILLTCDRNFFRYITKIQGACLFCDINIPIPMLNLSICYQREAWVCYSDDSYLPYSLKLGRATQRAGAIKTRLTPFPISPINAGEIK